MTALKRILAYVIDYFVIVGPLVSFSYAFLPFPAYFPTTMDGGAITWLLPYGSLTLLLVGPLIVLGTLTGLTGWTPGKLIFSLRVRSPRNQPIGVLRGIGRELIKALSLGFFIVMIYAVICLFEHGRTFYDEWLCIDVVDRSPWGMTKTQKNWRKYMDSKAGGF